MTVLKKDQFILQTQKFRVQSLRFSFPVNKQDLYLVHYFWELPDICDSLSQTTSRDQKRVSDSQSIGATLVGRNIIKINVPGWDFTPSEFISHFKTKDVIVYGKLTRLTISNLPMPLGYFFQTLEAVSTDLVPALR